MARSYEKLDLNDLREDTIRVIKKNFPESPYLTGKDLKKIAPGGVSGDPEPEFQPSAEIRGFHMP